MGNAFSVMLRRDRLTLTQAHRALASFRDIPVHYVDVDIARALTLSDELGIYAYDAHIIEAAIRQSCPIRTSMWNIGVKC